MEQERKSKTYKSKVVKATVTVIGEPDLDVWANKVKQVYSDIDAGRYKKEEQTIIA